MRTKEKQWTALVYKACPCCGKKDEEQSEIVLHTRFGDLSEIHNKITGFGHLCKQCQELTAKAIACVVVDSSKSDDMKNPYRTGNLFGLSEEWCNKCFKEPMAKEVITRRMFYMDYKDAIAIGLPVNYTP